MTKPLVERYEQILAQDPASTAFVELAKALLARGDFARAIEVCQQGLSHHKDSVVGRVLWGKALIQLSRPAEAMEQFDQAIAIDRENPHAYNLIGEVLLHKQLYRSALPILKKAMALQPNDMRVRQWLEQTQRALSGAGPAPVVADPTLPDTAALESSAPDITAPNPSHPELPALQPENPTAVTAPNPSHPEIPAQRASNPGVPVLRPSNPEPSARASNPGIAAVRASNPGIAAVRPSNPGIPASRPSNPALNAPTQSNPAITGPTVIEESSALAAALAPSAGAPSRELTHPSGATDDDDDQTDPLATVDGPRGSFRLPPPSLDPVTVAATVPELPPVKPSAPSPSRDEPTVALSQDLLEDLAQESQPPRKPPKRELLDVVAPTEEQLPIIAPRPPPQLRGTPPGPPRPPPLSSSGAKRQLLTDLPAEPAPTVPLELPKVELSPVAAQAIAQEYERELREKLAEKTVSKNESLFARHGLKLAAAMGVVVVLGVGAVAFLQTRAANRGQDLNTALSMAKKGIAQDTARSYREALESLEVALKMSNGSTEAWALSAQAHAVLFAEHGASGEHRQQAELALSKPGVEASFPAHALMARYLVANGSGRDAARKALVESKLDAAEVHLLAGQLLLGKGDSRGALERFKKASELAPHSARTLVALGEYYREAGDCPRALGFYATAAQVSPHHPT
ncbi:MAG TPA: tetratricopeptide repeat protein, partial [Myxococcaceae bacterium]|nr:tetratricopeptide repeat protein [Myxococcaceae bacterium]